MLLKFRRFVSKRIKVGHKDAAQMIVVHNMHKSGKVSGGRTKPFDLGIIGIKRYAWEPGAPG